MVHGMASYSARRSSTPPAIHIHSGRLWVGACATGASAFDVDADGAGWWSDSPAGCTGFASGIGGRSSVGHSISVGRYMPTLSAPAGYNRADAAVRISQDRSAGGLPPNFPPVISRDRRLFRPPGAVAVPVL